LEASRQTKDVEMMRSRLGALKIKKIFSGELSTTLLEGGAKPSLTGILIAHTRPPTERDRTFTD
jgi:hypothetical protein